MLRLLCTLLLALPPLSAAVTAVHLVDRSDVLAGKPFGAAGPYERIIAKARFAIDPALAQNANIPDITLAPRNEKGLVEFSADLYVLKPRDPARGNGTLLFEVSNRGGKGMLSRFTFARGANNPQSEEDFGDALLLEQGFTLVWLGWQADVPAGADLLRLDAPVLRGLEGLVRAEFLPDARTTRMPLSDRNHLTYAALDKPYTLTFRETVTGPKHPVPAASWRFNADRTAIESDSGFQPGLLYEMVYTSRDPRLQGVGLAAVRDLISYLKYPNPGISLLGDQARFLKRALAFGISQSGRFLRTFLYEGFNEDERGRKVFDGVWADVAGAGRGSFLHRFAQPSRDGYAFFNTLYHSDVFPFSDLDQTDPLTARTDGLLRRIKPETMPRIFYSHGSWEYWNRCAALVHTSLDGTADVPLGAGTRLYITAGSQHSPGNLPRAAKGAQFPVNPNDHRPLQRALLMALHEWVRDGKEPPASVYPTLAAGQLVPREKLAWPSAPLYPKAAYRMSGEPENPTVGAAFPVLLPQVDQDGIELAGIRLPVVAAPLGTFTGWNLRTPEAGSPSQLAPVLGAFFAFPKDRIHSLYPDKAAYLRRIDSETSRLVGARLLLERDRARVADHAARLWDFVAAPPAR